MPTYAGRIEPEQIDAVVAWLRADETRATQGAPGGADRTEGREDATP
jgi:mono/diheme cytochrome c family protein